MPTSLRTLCLALMPGLVGVVVGAGRRVSVGGRCAGGGWVGRRAGGPPRGRAARAAPGGGCRTGCGTCCSSGCRVGCSTGCATGCVGARARGGKLLVKGRLVGLGRADTSLYGLQRGGCSRPGREGARQAGELGKEVRLPRLARFPARVGKPRHPPDCRIWYTIWYAIRYRYLVHHLVHPGSGKHRKSPGQTAWWGVVRGQASPSARPPAPNDQEREGGSWVSGCGGDGRRGELGSRGHGVSARRRPLADPLRGQAEGDPGQARSRGACPGLGPGRVSVGGASAGGP